MSLCFASTPPVISADHPPTTLQANASTVLTAEWRDAEASRGPLFPGSIYYIQRKWMDGLAQAVWLQSLWSRPLEGDKRSGVSSSVCAWHSMAKLR